MHGKQFVPAYAEGTSYWGCTEKRFTKYFTVWDIQIWDILSINVLTLEVTEIQQNFEQVTTALQPWPVHKFVVTINSKDLNEN